MSTVLIGSSAAMISGYSLAATATATATAPAAAEFYPLIGIWHGQGELAEADQTPLKLTLELNCQKVSSGWAVSCSMQAGNEQLTMMESDLMGVDPVTGQAHWYAVTNQGETHDHLVNWPDAQTMQAHYSWAQDGKFMREKITFQLQDSQDMSFKSVVTADGKQVAAFSGKLKR